MDVEITLVDPVSKDTVWVRSGRTQGVRPWICPETGARDGEISVWYHGVTVSTKYGMEYGHSLLAEDTVDGAIEAANLAMRVAAKVAKVGVDAGLCEAHWGNRIVYGSQAYIDNEEGIVQREKDDALLNGG